MLSHDARIFLLHDNPLTRLVFTLCGSTNGRNKLRNQLVKLETQVFCTSYLRIMTAPTRNASGRVDRFLKQPPQH
jgi:hypothetical protein